MKFFHRKPKADNLRYFPAPVPTSDDTPEPDSAPPPVTHYTKDDSFQFFTPSERAFLNALRKSNNDILEATEAKKEADRRVAEAEFTCWATGVMARIGQEEADEEAAAKQQAITESANAKIRGGREKTAFNSYIKQLKLDNPTASNEELCQLRDADPDSPALPSDLGPLDGSGRLSHTYKEKGGDRLIHKWFNNAFRDRRKKPKQ